ncbi:histidine kinase dimerization/phosphoacceptor domain -containing protein [Roseicella sp. DB1501]|uniref:histidine kinase dimerization/phosphoacceptor domain -containing protein n=1 Tax=Roseicella sp. DB1501 TaxID=2730925 RepID=UPI001C2BBB69|nr:histidine kinase dimerization/phosphoacceptor domain -containing protein [Roseicella sp. DB1501]
MADRPVMVSGEGEALPQDAVEAEIAAVLAQLDQLSPAELDALPFGVIQLDGGGRVLFYNAMESRLSGRLAAAMLGRDFFHEIAPCTNLPAFHGRFLEGIRSGALNERFHFTFGFEPQPLRVEVHLRQSSRPGRYWIMHRVLGTLPPTRHRLAADRAQDAVARRARAEPVDPDICEREPIHLAGAVQPHAAMLACDPTTPGLKVRACSDSLADLLDGAGPEEIIGHGLAIALPVPAVQAIRAALETGALHDPAHPWRDTLRLGQRGVTCLATVHLHDGRLVVELERVPEQPEDFHAASAMQAQAAIARLRASRSLLDAAAVTVHELHAMTGFERLLVYRFDPDWNGEAIAEDKVSDWDRSLLGLRFPASDIPSQARALYARAPARFVVDRDAVPSAVRAEPRAGNETVDLSFAQTRALSPIHLEYQRNLGVNGSMSLSILVEGRLWGLVIGHHRRPHYVTPETRALAGVVADAFALRIQELESRAIWREHETSLEVRNALLERMAASDDFVAALTDGATTGETTLLDLFGATGAAVVGEGRIAPLGRTPPAAMLPALADWLRQSLPAGRRAFATDQLAAHFPPAATWQGEASGLLAVLLGREAERDYVLLWFRPEVVSTVVWGGDPRKPVLADSATQAVLPRRSFERWVEERRGHSAPWAPWQVTTAEAFAAGIAGIILRQGRRIAELTAKQEVLARALEQKEVLAREVDHRVKNSLQIVASVMRLQARRVKDPQAAAAFDDTYARVMSVARVHDSLQDSEDIENVDLGETLRRLCDDLAVGMAGADRRLDVNAERGVMVPSRTAVALSLVAAELVTNALKYAYAPEEPGRVEVHVRSRPVGGVEMTVCDFGRGLPQDWDSRARTDGGGLGMRLVRAMLERVGAAMEVTALGTPGTCITVAA